MPPSNCGLPILKYRQIMNQYLPENNLTQMQRMVSGQWYVAEGEEITNASKRAAQLMRAYPEKYYTDPTAARQILENLLGEVGQDVDLRPPFFFDYGSQLYIGDRTFINFNFTALDICTIEIGDDCQFGPGVQLLTAIHPLHPKARAARVEGGMPIKIGKNVWLGGGVIVLPGVEIGENTVIGAGSVVTKSLPANVVAAGNPARVLKEITDQTQEKIPGLILNHES